VGLVGAALDLLAYRGHWATFSISMSLAKGILILGSTFFAPLVMCAAPHLEPAIAPSTGPALIAMSLVPSLLGSVLMAFRR
jgi:hypothetical protein